MTQNLPTPSTCCCCAGEELGSLAPVGPEYEPAPSEYPVILGKTRDAVAAACSAFDPGGTDEFLPVGFRPWAVQERVQGCGIASIVCWPVHACWPVHVCWPVHTYVRPAAPRQGCGQQVVLAAGCPCR